MTPAHNLAFALPAPAPALSAHLAARDLARLLGDVLLRDDELGKTALKRARVALAWRELHVPRGRAEHRRASRAAKTAVAATPSPRSSRRNSRRPRPAAPPRRRVVSRPAQVLLVLTQNPSLEPWNVAKWRENPISDAAWTSEAAKIRARNARRRAKRRASAMVEVADRELGDVGESPPRDAHRSRFLRRRKRRASVLDRVDRLEAVLTERGARPTDSARGLATRTRDATATPSTKARPSLAAHSDCDGEVPSLDAVVAEPDDLADVLTRFQRNVLFTMFRLLDKDQDGLVSVTDLRWHYQSQGNVLSEAEATYLVEAVAVSRKGYYMHRGDGGLREVERTGFDFPELVAYCLWRVATEEPAAVDGGFGGGLRLDAPARRAVAETFFVRLKGLDERVVDVESPGGSRQMLSSRRAYFARGVPTGAAGYVRRPVYFVCGVPTERPGTSETRCTLCAESGPTRAAGYVRRPVYSACGVRTDRHVDARARPSGRVRPTPGPDRAAGYVRRPGGSPSPETDRAVGSRAGRRARRGVPRVRALLGPGAARPHGPRALRDPPARGAPHV